MKVTAVTKYQCGQCKRAHDTAKKAEECCICTKCHERPVRYDVRMGASSDCELCFTRSNLRYAQERQREAVVRLKEANQSLEDRKAELAKAKADVS